MENPNEQFKPKVWLSEISFSNNPFIVFFKSSYKYDIFSVGLLVQHTVYIFLNLVKIAITNPMLTSFAQQKKQVIDISMTILTWIFSAEMIIKVGIF